MRELEEELGIGVVETTAFMCVPYQYAERFVLLDFWIVAEWSGEARGVEGQEIAWRCLDSLLPGDFPPADEAVLAALQDVYGSRPAVV